MSSRVDLELTVELPVSSPLSGRIIQILKFKVYHHAGAVYGDVCKWISKLGENSILKYVLG